MKWNKVFLFIAIMGCTVLSMGTVSGAKTKKSTLYIKKNQKIKLGIKKVQKYKTVVKDSRIISMSKKGVVKGKKVGKTTLVLKRGNQKLQYKVHVVKELSLGEKELTLRQGMQEQLEFSIGNKWGTWKSTDKSVATVSKSGKVTAREKGSCKIIMTYLGKRYVCKVTVTESLSGGGWISRHIYATVNAMETSKNKEGVAVTTFHVTATNEETKGCNFSFNVLGEPVRAYEWDQAAKTYCEDKPVEIHVGDSVVIYAAVLIHKRNWGLDRSAFPLVWGISGFGKIIS